MKNYFFLAALVFILGCKNDNAETNTVTPTETVVSALTANQIIDKAIDVAGGERFQKSSLKFEFRDVYYQALRKNHEFLLVRLKVEGTDSIFDMLSNVGYERYKNDAFVQLEDSIAKNYEASVNSVHYFSVLPYGLNDKAVNKTLLGTETIKDKAYFKIKVTFDQDGGGEDFEDEFIYWIHTDSFKVDYLAYSYEEESGRGQRFREAYNERYRGGLRFVDYNNFKTDDAALKLEDLAKAFEANTLKLLSKIELENVTVELVND
ncbi:DUF6503 family protein [Winogradskyella arenosi]|uniref:Deoxyribose-phosphate aldolase n=1 Tax=Winogradskyella arenosi TaxID=533325 RepID=A0A368ZGC5_9FLAO|nr:DUF6503 family protein [Winogradskyella arenosi]RCW90868.1 hypothetical protein DFQ08_104268 [Winogradskyella arenosi]